MLSDLGEKIQPEGLSQKLDISGHLILTPIPIPTLYFIFVFYLASNTYSTMKWTNVNFLLIIMIHGLIESPLTVLEHVSSCGRVELHFTQGSQTWRALWVEQRKADD